MVTMMTEQMRSATTLLSTFLEKLKHIHTYRDSKPTTSILTITSTLYMVKLQDLFRTEEKPVSLWHRELTVLRRAEQNGLLASLELCCKT